MTRPIWSRNLLRLVRHHLSWSSDQFRALMAARITSYLKRTNQWPPIASRLPRQDFLRQQAIVALAFDDPMPWGGGDRKRPPHVVLWTLTAHRPRWLVELCRVAGKSAAKRHMKRINWDDIDAQLAEFGRKRVEDTVAEFRKVNIRMPPNHAFNRTAGTGLLSRDCRWRRAG